VAAGGGVCCASHHSLFTIAIPIDSQKLNMTEVCTVLSALCVLKNSFGLVQLKMSLAFKLAVLC